MTPNLNDTQEIISDIIINEIVGDNRLHGVSYLNVEHKYTIILINGAYKEFDYLYMDDIMFLDGSTGMMMVDDHTNLSYMYEGLDDGSLILLPYNKYTDLLTI
jgi:hypothetical protein